MNDIDVWQNALNEIDINEAVQFVSRGKLIVETTQVELYNKIQALLNCPELECSHRFLYSLDPEELTEAEATKVCNLYKLGQERGFLEPDVDDVDVDVDVDASVETPATAQPVQAVQPAPPPAPTSAYTVLYSAMRNGNVVTGEAYSNAINPRSAKADAISQLQKAGYSNIAILAIECGDPDCCGTSVSNVQTTNNVVEEPLQTADIPDYASEDDEQDVAEDDMLDNRHHNGHINEGDARNNAIITVDLYLADTPEKSDAEEFLKWSLGNKASQVKVVDNVDVDKWRFSGPLWLCKKMWASTMSDDGSKWWKSTDISIPWKYKGPDADLNDMYGNPNDFSEVIVQEDDMLDNRQHNGHIDEAGEEEKDAEDDKGSEEADDAAAEEQDDGEADAGDNDDKEEQAEEPDEKLKDEPKDDGKSDAEELDAGQKAALKDSYKKAFKAAMLKCKYDGKKFEDLTLEEKVKFFTVLSQAWGTKADPSQFMTDKELDQLEKIVIKK